MSHQHFHHSFSHIPCFTNLVLLLSKGILDDATFTSLLDQRQWEKEDGKLQRQRRRASSRESLRNFLPWLKLTLRVLQRKSRSTFLWRTRKKRESFQCLHRWRKSKLIRHEGMNQKLERHQRLEHLSDDDVVVEVKKINFHSRFLDSHAWLPCLTPTFFDSC